MTQSQDGSKHDEKVSALESLAGGGDPTGETPAEETAVAQEDQSASLPEEPPDLATALGNLEGAVEPSAEIAEQVGVSGGGDSGPAAITAARARAARLHQQARRNHAVQFRQILIPVLIGVAVILLVLGAVALAKTPPTPAASDGADHNWLRDPTVWKSFAIIAFPMGAILLLGAWMFHKDVQRLKQQR